MMYKNEFRTFLESIKQVDKSLIGAIIEAYDVCDGDGCSSMDDTDPNEFAIGDDIVSIIEKTIDRAVSDGLIDQKDRDGYVDEFIMDHRLEYYGDDNKTLDALNEWIATLRTNVESGAKYESNRPGAHNWRDWVNVHGAGTKVNIPGFSGMLYTGDVNAAEFDALESGSNQNEYGVGNDTYNVVVFDGGASTFIAMIVNHHGVNKVKMTIRSGDMDDSTINSLMSMAMRVSGR